jgi:NTP pyrophosphatase (non-canonical NTP hydrolase)|tara:strand:+ start:510 stop:1274 length:765 start_codon:yes stop_codon:yes gene_type:complete
MYYIYHIPGKKIGVTRNLKNRVTLMQGYKEGEYEVLEQSTDIDYISGREIELQKSYRYKVDRQSYKNLINKNNKMKLNSTEQTTTFPMPVNKLKGNLMDNVGLKWETDHGTFGLDDQTINWICKNAKVSMFNVNRCYIYNKAYASEFLESKVEVPSNTVYDDIRAWAKAKGIYKSGDSRTQYIKLMEEAGELAQALLKNDETEVIDAIGDMVVVLTNLAKLRGHNIEDCITSAYGVIKDRQGKMINGTFVKQTL